jgi:hypothetical protein
MPIYTDSKGNQKDTSTMVIEYLQRALAKAKQNNDQENIDALEWEINKRQS